MWLHCGSIRAMATDYVLHFGAGLERFAGVEGGEWHEVTGGDLAHPVLIRVRETDEGRLACTGLMIGASEAEEVTATSARVPLGAILESIGTTIVDSHEDFGDLFRRAARLDTAPLPRPVRRTPGSHGPTDDELRSFRAAHDRALITNPRQAVKQAADAMSISVSTAHRWKHWAQERLSDR